MIHQRTGQTEKEEGRRDERGPRDNEEKERKRWREQEGQREGNGRSRRSSLSTSAAAIQPDCQSHLMEANEVGERSGFTTPGDAITTVDVNISGLQNM